MGAPVEISEAFGPDYSHPDHEGSLSAACVLMSQALGGIPVGWNKDNSRPGSDIDWYVITTDWNVLEKARTVLFPLFSNYITDEWQIHRATAKVILNMKNGPRSIGVDPAVYQDCLDQFVGA